MIGKYTVKEINDSFKYLLASRTIRSIAISFTTSALPLYLVFVLNQDLIGVSATYFVIILFVSLTSFIFGMLGDRIGYGNTMIIAEVLPLLGLTGLTISTFVTDNASLMLTIVVISAMLAGISTAGGMRGAFSAGQQALVANNWKDQNDRVHRLSRIFTMAAIGSILGSLLLALQGTLTNVLHQYGFAELQSAALAFRYMFAICMLLMFLSMLSLFFIKETAKTEKKQALFIKKESSPHIFKVMASQIFAGIGVGLAIPILPAIVAKSYALDASTASQFIGYMFGASYIIIAMASFYMSRLIYRKKVNTLKVASIVRAMQGVAMVLIAFVISIGIAIPYGAEFGLLLLSMLYSVYAMFIGIGAPLRSAINIGGVNNQDYGTASAVMGMSIQLPQASVGLSGFLSEALPSFLSLPIAIGGIFMSVSGVIYWKLLNRDEPVKKH
jgi:MFS family permease